MARECLLVNECALRRNLYLLAQLFCFTKMKCMSVRSPPSDHRVKDPRVFVIAQELRRNVQSPAWTRGVTDVLRSNMHHKRFTK